MIAHIPPGVGDVAAEDGGAGSGLQRDHLRTARGELGELGSRGGELGDLGSDLSLMQIIIQRLDRVCGLIRIGLVAAKTKPLGRKSLGNPWRRLSYPEESAVAPNGIRTR